MTQWISWAAPSFTGPSSLTDRWADFSGLLKEGRCFSLDWEAAGALFLEEDFAVFTDFEDATLAGNESDFLVVDDLDFSRHTVGFGEVVSLSAVFDLDHCGGKMWGFTDLANEKFVQLFDCSFWLMRLELMVSRSSIRLERAP